jgi:DNA-directed RNA polymerase specialized sigma24 family protein
MGDLEHAAVGSHLRLLFEAGTATRPSDGHLLERFVSRRGELAFTALVERHGPMVQRVCYAVLGDHHEAQDAFQATLLVLARSARSIRRRDSLASWLHGVTFRVGGRLRSASARRLEHERSWAAQRAVETEGADELEAFLHEAIGRLRPAHSPPRGDRTGHPRPNRRSPSAR